MIETLFRLGFSLMCGVGGLAIALWAMDTLPDWWRRWRQRKRERQEI